MKKIMIFVGLLMVLLSTLACSFTIDTPHIGDGVVEGSGDMLSETRAVSGFHAIRIEGNYAVIVKTGSQEELRLEAQKEILPNLETRVENGALVLTTKSDVHLSTTQTIRAYVTVKSLDELSILGSGTFDVQSPLQSDKFTINLKGSGNVTLPQLETSGLVVDIPGSGVVEAAGKTDQLDIEISGSGGFKGAEMIGSKGKVSISGSGTAQVNAQDELNANIAGSGSIQYSGNPVINSSITGSGTIQQVN